MVAYPNLYLGGMGGGAIVQSRSLDSRCWINDDACPSRELDGGFLAEYNLKRLTETGRPRGSSAASSGSFRLASGAPKELSVDLRRLTRRMVCVLGFSE